jgi:hypothetical protein
MMTDADYRRIAKLSYHSDGEVEIDDDAIVSRVDPEDGGFEEGAYVQAWVWVYKPEPRAGEDDE